jgi:hypothetical protein
MQRAGNSRHRLSLAALRAALSDCSRSMPGVAFGVDCLGCGLRWAWAAMERRRRVMIRRRMWLGILWRKLRMKTGPSTPLGDLPRLRSGTTPRLRSPTMVRLNHEPPTPGWCARGLVCERSLGAPSHIRSNPRIIFPFKADFHAGCHTLEE